MFNLLEAVASELNQLEKLEQPELHYDALSDALYWSDELPLKTTRNPESLLCLQQVFRYRMTLILGDPDVELEIIWNKAKRLFPKWPGFSAERCAPDSELVDLYWHYHDRAINAFRSLPD